MSSLTKHFRRSQGQGIIEFALALPIFALAFFAIVEFSHLFYVRLTLHHALREAGRYMITGRADVPDLSTPNPNDTLPRPESIEAIFEKYLIGTGVGLQGFTMTCGGVDCGGGGATSTYAQPVRVILTATFTKSFFTGLFDNLLGGPITFTLSQTWVNEPFV